jgi:hypothetical protein
MPFFRRGKQSIAKEAGMKLRGALIVLMLAMVVVYMLYFVKVGKKSYLRTTIDANDRIRVELTKVNMATLERAINLYAGTEGQPPADLNALFATRQFSGDPSDGWGTLIKYEPKSEGGYRLIAAGRDRTFGTADDIVLDR